MLLAEQWNLEAAYHLNDATDCAGTKIGWMASDFLLYSISRSFSHSIMTPGNILPNYESRGGGELFTDTSYNDMAF